jgi:hypothetical protein
LANLKLEKGQVNLMKTAKFSRYYLLLGLPVLLALVGLVWGRTVGGGKHATFDLDDLNGRYVSAEYAYDISSVHPETQCLVVSLVDPPAPPAGPNIGPPIWFATTSVMEADGKGNVCGESDGFYSLMTAGQIPGGNLGPSFFHGTYTIDAHGRITISTCSDSGFCATTGACGTVTKMQVGYLQSNDGEKVTTVEQVFGDPNLSPGFLVHSRVWAKDASDQNHY